MHLGEPARRTVSIIHVSRLFDPYTQSIVKDKTIVVDDQSGRILNVVDDLNTERSQLSSFPISQTWDLRHLQLVLPGLVDTHVHLFLHPYKETSWLDQVTRESIPERTIRAVSHARKTLAAGYTTVRDLGTEGAGDADIALRQTIADDLIPGPRYFTANRAIVSTGAYGPKTNLRPGQDGVDGVTGAQVADGAEECRKAVRKQVGAGADWIKVYYDYSVRSRQSDVAPGIASRPFPLFGTDELQAIVATAKGLNTKVAFHASALNSSSLDFFRNGDVHSVEHGPLFDKSVFRNLGSAVWSPTLAAYSSHYGANWEAAAKVFKAALAYNAEVKTSSDKTLTPVRIACGGDTGVFAHGLNALELELMVQLGADPLEVLSWATLGGWECVRNVSWDDVTDEEGKVCNSRLEALQEDVKAGRVNGPDWERRAAVGNDVPFGVIAPGFSADLIGIGGSSGDLERDIGKALKAENVLYVMKAGRVYKSNGTETT